MQVQHLLKSAAARLAEAGIESSDLEAELLLLDCLGISRSTLFLMENQEVDASLCKQYQEFTSRRCSREPLQYIVGNCQFWSLDFHITPDVLIPRPETEFLLEHVFAVISRKNQIIPHCCLDLCTGSGVIGIVLATQYPKAFVYASDYSVAALHVAKVNVERHDLSGQVSLVCADLFSGFRNEVQWDLIVSNPPYVKANDIAGLEPEVRDWEPHLALSGGMSGLDIISKICRDAPGCLVSDGWLFIEIGADIAKPVLDIFQSSDSYKQVEIVSDWAGKPRVLQAQRKQ
jgi:release factor glutamine methyltransferase